MKQRQYLEQLAQLYDIETSYEDVHGQRQYASDDALVGMLSCLGAAIHSPADVPDALAHRAIELGRRRCDPVTVVSEGTSPVLRFRVPAVQSDRRFRARIELEQNESILLDGSFSDLPTDAVYEAAGERFVEKSLVFDRTLPTGYHQTYVELDDVITEASLLCPPTQAWSFPGVAWGLFAPLYALHSERSLGGGDLRDLETFMEWGGALGAKLIGTLPLLPTFLDEPFDPSPYAPVSRLFWNEFYLNMDRLIETTASDPVRKRLTSTAFQEEVSELRKQPFVDYRKQMALKRSVLEELTREFFEKSGQDRVEFEAFVENHPRVRDYAQFRAATELAQKPWYQWPRPCCDGTLSVSDFREEDVRYHLYVQWRCAQQMATLSQKADALGIGLYLDLPLSVHRSGYDVWKEREVFLQGCSLGAPPDTVFTGGQRWGITPLHPMGLERQKYRYFIDCIRHHMACAGALRIDHVMGFHRAYCMPEGVPANEGVYVRYHPEVFYAVLAIESTQTKTLVIGEDLGIVPREVRASMQRVGVSRMHVFQYELAGTSCDPFAHITKDVVAGVNNHDMPPFARWWEGLDVEDRIAREALTPTEAARVRDERHRARHAIQERLRASGQAGDRWEDMREILLDILNEYASSPAGIVLINIEDLWMEREPQNVPGTGYERPNWRRKLRYSLEMIKEMPDVIYVLKKIDEERQGVR